MANANMHAAKRAKNDEFYTRFIDIEREMLAYVDYDADVFRDKVVLLPADDPSWSNFTKFFATKFDDLGLRRLIATSYNPGGHGKVFILDRDIDGDGRTNLADIEWTELDGDGDFRSAEVTALRDEADFVITNPPFSLFREFFQWVRDGGVKFSLVGNKMSLKYLEVWPSIQNGETWIGNMSMSTDMLFRVPEDAAAALVASGKPGSKYRIVDGEILGRAASTWFTNIDHGRRHMPLDLNTAKENLRFAPKLAGKRKYERYDNFDAIEVPETRLIPSDYDGVMGVPISFLDKFCPEQFEIIGAWNAGALAVSLGIPKTTTITQSGGQPKTIQWNGPVVKKRPLADRILIKHRKNTTNQKASA